MKNYYSQYAYRSDRPRPQPEQELLPHLGFAERLPWGHTLERISLDLQGKGAINLALQEERRLKKYQPNIPREKWSIHNHEYLQAGDYSKFSIILNFILAMKMLAIPATILILIDFLLEYWDGKLSFIALFYDYIPTLLILPGIFYYLWIISILIIKFCPQ